MSNSCSIYSCSSSSCKVRSHLARATRSRDGATGFRGARVLVRHWLHSHHSKRVLDHTVAKPAKVSGKSGAPSGSPGSVRLHYREGEAGGESSGGETRKGCLKVL